MKIKIDYNLVQARADFLAGLTVAAISLPQAMAYALIAGVDPRYGLYSAIVVTIVASIFGSSSHLINGPSNAISIVVFSALAFLDPDARFDVAQALFLLAILVGILQILIALLKLGDLTRYISESVIIGFMAGASVLIALGQVGNFLGLGNVGNGHQSVLYRFWLTLTQGGAVNFHALGIGAGTIVLVLILRKLARTYRLPQIEMLTALIVATGIAAYFRWTVPAANGKVVLAVVGNVPASLPVFHIPLIKLSWLRQLSGSALAIAVLGLMEALAIAKSIAYQTRQRLDYNRQCFAEGIANLTGGFFQSLPGSGSLTRSAINYQAGAATRFSGVFTAATVAVVLLLFAPLARYIPKSVLAGLLFVIAARLIDWKRLRYALRARWYDAGLVLVTALAAIFVDVEYSILIGVALSILLFVPRAARLSAKELIVSPEGIVRERLPDDAPSSDLLIYDVEGELFFGAGPEIDNYFDLMKDRALHEDIHYVVLRVKRTRNPDVVFFERLEHFLHETQAHGITVLLAGVRPDFAKRLGHLKFYEWLPKEHIFYEEEQIYSATLRAVRYAYSLLGKSAKSGASPEEGLASAGSEFYYLV
jgi:sulfate permease, SulP family